MGSVVQAETVKEFEKRLDMVFSELDIYYYHEADTKFLNLKNLVLTNGLIKKPSMRKKTQIRHKRLMPTTRII